MLVSWYSHPPKSHFIQAVLLKNINNGHTQWQRLLTDLPTREIGFDVSKEIIFLSGDGQKRSQLRQGICLVLRSRCDFDVISFRVDEITSGDITFHALLHRTLRWREIPDFTPVFLTNWQTFLLPPEPSFKIYSSLWEWERLPGNFLPPW